MTREHSTVVYRLSFWGLTAWLRWRFDFRTSGAEHVPAEGGCIVVSNHASFLDPPVLACGIPHRFVRLMGRETLFRHPIAGWWANHVGVIQLDRTRGDVGAMKAALAIIKQGGVFGLFPEGTRTLDGRLQPAKSGIGFLMAKAKVPVVPAYLSGTFEACPKGATRLTYHPIRADYGPPLTPAEIAAFAADRSGYEAIARLVMDRIAALKPAAGEHHA